MNILRPPIFKRSLEKPKGARVSTLMEQQLEMDGAQNIKIIPVEIKGQEYLYCGYKTHEGIPVEFVAKPSIKKVKDGGEVANTVGPIEYIYIYGKKIPIPRGENTEIFFVLGNRDTSGTFAGNEMKGILKNKREISSPIPSNLYNITALLHEIGHNTNEINPFNSHLLINPNSRISFEKQASIFALEVLSQLPLTRMQRRIIKAIVHLWLYSYESRLGITPEAASSVFLKEHTGKSRLIRMYKTLPHILDDLPLPLLSIANEILLRPPTNIAQGSNS